jgi:hypothetical protein
MNTEAVAKKVVELDLENTARLLAAFFTDLNKDQDFTP